ncbi:DUF1707 and DUF2154 domain-containing protein [Thalassotalea euphylliae]|uniref:DUF1707 and DUF2154 domain-containing protein n=1 Tax=Thalassotalea euphylliae TaxID=1655234 RepID=A0A3E0TPK2_9GAMM|nr:LiaF domain-containing protein [Thalassotalea euphylliae]REL26277.1 DUF1707 and DUF2154 domain-containing protein [Thalassotalea euphylliae]
MPVAIQDRPTQTVRDEVIDKLIMNYSHGELSYEAFERRLDIAMESEDNHEILAQAADLDLAVDQAYVASKKQDLTFNFDNDPAADRDTLVSIFGGSDRSGAWKVAKEIRVLSVFSGSDIDFSQAQFSYKQTHVKIFSLFSGDDIYIPEGVNVVTKAFCIFGGIDNKSNTMVSKDGPTLVIEGLVIFGGLDIKLKKSLKERFVAFADSLKGMFG